MKNVSFYYSPLKFNITLTVSMHVLALYRKLFQVISIVYDQESSQMSTQNLTNNTKLGKYE